MLIVAGHLTVAPGDRETYLAAVSGVAGLARASAGCLAFVQVADPLEPDRIVIYEQWESDAALQAFRTAGSPDDGSDAPAPQLLDAEVRKYRIASVEAP